MKTYKWTHQTTEYLSQAGKLGTEAESVSTRLIGASAKGNLTVKFVYCPPGISCANTLESDARTGASKHE